MSDSCSHKMFNKKDHRFNPITQRLNGVYRDLSALALLHRKEVGKTLQRIKKN